MRCNVDANVDVDSLRDEDTQSVYDNVNENNSQFTIDNSQLTISSGAASLNPQPSSIDLNLSCQQDLDTNLDTFTHMQACAALPDEDTQGVYENANVDENYTHRSPLTAHRSTIGVVSRLESIKGMDLVVPAFAEVLKRFPEVRLLVVGDGSLRAMMEQQAAELGCADRITWVGRQPQEELAQWYGQMDIVLMPSRSEGFGLTAIEAMANGCVMVASNVGGLPEVVRDGVCGLLHRTLDVQDMSAKVSELLGDNELYSRLRTQALCEVEKYSFERYAKSICNLYERLKVNG
ncbi:MAG: glycosyltransferase family 4 protein [Bacteroidaceae bacterium]|nr:glycosyltransferase family 4 protein [Bacteroidaceae bacterium]